ncbi:MAG: hypothetical protein J6B94_07635 [Lachnospiraceae bacterium]|nr:hypothetical protein [Lachnospiraceae bacterium]
MKRYVITALILIITAAAGFTIPPNLLKWQDEKRLEQSHTETAEEVIVTATTDMTLVEKLQLMKKDTITTMPLETGKKYNQYSIKVKVQEEVKKLYSLSLSDLRQDHNISYEVADVYFVLDREDGKKSMIFWEVYVSTDDYEAWLIVDDETGKILQFSEMTLYDTSAVVGEEQVSESDLKALEILAEKWGEYLGCELLETRGGSQDVVVDKEKAITEKEVIWGHQIIAKYQDDGGSVECSIWKYLDNVKFAFSTYGN